MMLGLVVNSLPGAKTQSRSNICQLSGEGRFLDSTVFVFVGFHCVETTIILMSVEKSLGKDEDNMNVCVDVFRLCPHWSDFDFAVLKSNLLADIR